jgi:hypothetical protein
MAMYWKIGVQLPPKRPCGFDVHAGFFLKVTAALFFIMVTA